MNISEKLEKVELLLKSHRTDEANNLIEELKKAEPENYEVLYWFGVCAKMKGNLEIAESAFQKVINRDPNHYKALYGLGLILENKKDVDAAIAAYQRAINIYPSYRHALNKLAQHGVHVSSQKSAKSHKRDTRMDYSRLESLLKEEKWKKADDETADIMSKLSGHRKIRPQDVRELPCDDVAEINSIWIEHSKGRFGFSVQKKIYQSVGGLISPKGYDPATFDWFIKRIGWHSTKKVAFRKFGSALKGHRNISYSLSAPVGHLPGAWVLPETDILVTAEGGHFFFSLIAFLIYAAFSVGILGIIGGLISQNPGGVVVGAILGFFLSLQLPVCARKRRKEVKRAIEAQKKLIMLFDRLPN